MEGDPGLKEGRCGLGPFLLLFGRVSWTLISPFRPRVICECTGLFHSHNRMIDSFMVRCLSEC